MFRVDGRRRSLALTTATAIAASAGAASPAAAWRAYTESGNSSGTLINFVFEAGAGEVNHLAVSVSSGRNVKVAFEDSWSHVDVALIAQRTNLPGSSCVTETPHRVVCATQSPLGPCVPEIECADNVHPGAVRVLLADSDDRMTVSGRPIVVNVDGGDGADRLSAVGEMALVATGGNGPDTLLGGDAVDKLTGGAGADLIVGGPGADTVAGSDGDDTISLRDGEQDSATCGTGADVLTGDLIDVLLSSEPPGSCETDGRSA